MRERRLAEIKESLRSYLSDMFSSMLASFTAALEAQFARLQQAYARCLKERNCLLAEQEGLNSMKKSIANLFSYVEQLEQQLTLSPVAFHINNEYYECRREVGIREDEPLSDRSTLRFNLSTSGSSSSRRFERKTSKRGTLKQKVPAEDQKENVGVNLYEPLRHKNSVEQQIKRT